MSSYGYPIHFDDKHRIEMTSHLKVCDSIAVDIIRIIEQMSKDQNAKESFVKTEKYEIVIKR